jgi:hypothetical protein
MTSHAVIRAEVIAARDPDRAELLADALLGTEWDSWIVLAGIAKAMAPTDPERAGAAPTLSAPRTFNSGCWSGSQMQPRLWVWPPSPDHAR